MKEILILLSIVALTIQCKAQTISIETYSTEYTTGNKDLFEDGIKEIRDINNVLDKYIGTWKYTSANGITYEFRINKGIEERSYFSREGLFIRYKITNSSGDIIENTLDIESDNSDFVIKGSSFLNSTYRLLYGGREIDCGQFGKIFITLITPDQNTLKMEFIPEVQIQQGKCPQGVVEQVLPTGGVNFIRQ